MERYFVKYHNISNQPKNKPLNTGKSRNIYIIFLLIETELYLILDIQYKCNNKVNWQSHVTAAFSVTKTNL